MGISYMYLGIKCLGIFGRKRAMEISGSRVSLDRTSILNFSFFSANGQFLFPNKALLRISHLDIVTFRNNCA